MNLLLLDLPTLNVLLNYIFLIYHAFAGYPEVYHDGHHQLCMYQGYLMLMGIDVWNHQLRLGNDDWNHQLWIYQMLMGIDDWNHQLRLGNDDWNHLHLLGMSHCLRMVMRTYRPHYLLVTHDWQCSAVVVY